MYFSISMLGQLNSAYSLEQNDWDIWHLSSCKLVLDYHFLPKENKIEILRVYFL